MPFIGLYSEHGRSLAACLFRFSHARDQSNARPHVAVRRVAHYTSTWTDGHWLRSDSSAAEYSPHTPDARSRLFASLLTSDVTVPSAREIVCRSWMQFRMVCSSYFW